ncbi:MAG: hypothetical protein HYS06_02340, partial [Methylocystis sp.]|nr:hypothetical protein [Methylocystis sp.]
MSIDLAPTSQSPAPAVAPRIGKRSDSPIETQQTVLGEDGEFANLLSAMDGDSSFQAERPSMRAPASNPQQLREGKADPAPKPPVPLAANGAPQGLSNVTANASLVQPTWPASFMRAGLQEPAVFNADDAARSSLGLGASAERNVSFKDDAGNGRANLPQQRSVEQTLVTDDERLSVSQISFPLDARLGIEATHRQGRPEDSVVLMPSTVIEHEAIPHETIQNVTISSLAPHFPAVLSNMLVDRALVPTDNEQRNVSAHMAPASQLAETGQQIGAPIEILTPESKNVAPRQSFERAFAPDDEGLFVSQALLSPDAQPEIEAKPEPERLANTVDTAPSETIRHVSIKSLETHFPAVVSNMLGDRAAIPNDN